jgi:hypothetical protein
MVFVLNVGAGEVVSIIVRKRNSGVISLAAFDQSVLVFHTEIIKSRAVHKLSVGNRLAFSSFPLISAHAINSTDAIMLKSALGIARKLRKNGDDLVLVSSEIDRR